MVKTNGGLYGCVQIRKELRALYFDIPGDFVVIFERYPKAVNYGHMIGFFCKYKICTVKSQRLDRLLFLNG